MSKTKNQKNDAIETYKASLDEYQTFFIVEPQALDPVEATALKKDLAPLGSKYNLVKNSLFEKAMEANGMPITNLGKGQHAIVFSSDKVSETAKIIKKHAVFKDKERLVLMGGILNKQAISAAQAMALADLPSKEVLLGQLLSVMNGPMRGFVTVLQGNMQKFAYLLKALEEQKASAA